MTVRLPLAQPARIAPGSSPELEIDEPLPLRRLTILAVEDTEDTLETLRQMLETLGARVMTARDGHEALNAQTLVEKKDWNCLMNEAGSIGCCDGRLCFQCVLNTGASR